MKIYESYKGCSKIPQLYEAGATGGVATTLALAALDLGLVDGMVVSRCHETYVAHNLEELLESCGSIYEEFPYVNLGGTKVGQIGKPCNINNKYKFKISLFCSHTIEIQKERITKINRDTFSKRFTPFKCWFCRDHVGLKADINVGDTQTNPKENVLIIKSNKGLSVLEYALKMDMLCLEQIDYSAIVEKQPYLWRWWRKR